MRHTFLLLVSAICLLSGCMPQVYYQLAHISSSDVSQNDDDAYVFSDSGISIAYDFWHNKGRFDFTITNTTDEEIYVDLSRSYFILNGIAYDYYLDRTYSITESSGKTTGTTKAASASVSGAASTGIVYLGHDVNVGVTAGLSSLHGESLANYDGAAFSVEYREKPVVCIPANTSKVFIEYAITDKPYKDRRKLAESPNKFSRSNVVRFAEDESPYAFENRIAIKRGDDCHILRNSFYVSEIMNSSLDDAMPLETIEEHGKTMSIRNPKYMSPATFYIEYYSKE